MTDKRFWVGTSFKMNKTLAEALDFARALAEAGVPDTPVQRFVIPPFTSVREVKQALTESGVLVGAQNMHWQDSGAWTGEISPVMLKDCGLDLVELGHSERRAHFGETDETVALKVAAALRHGLIPLVCIGETLEEREQGRAAEVLSRQVQAALTPAAGSSSTVLLAYEPVWAIGVNGIPATVDYASARHRDIAAIALATVGRTVPVLYGGSVDASNCAELIAAPGIDGLFIGRAAWQVAGYLDIVARAQAAIRRRPDFRP